MLEKVAPIIAPDKDLMLKHLDMLFGRALKGRVEITAIHTDKAAHHGARSRFFDVDDLHAAADYAEGLNAQPGWNVYVGAALRNEDVFPGKAADDSDFFRAYAVWADADDGEQSDGARAVYREKGITPPFVVVTGRQPSKRAQLWWPLDNPIDDINVLRGSLRGIAAALKTDPKVCTGKQLMRLGGGVNWPKKEDRVLERTEVVIVKGAAWEFTLEQIHRAFPPMERADLSAAIPADTGIAHGGALGLEERIVDGREDYAFRLTRAHLVEFIASYGAAPSPPQLYESLAPTYFAKIDQSRPGRGPTFLMQKCVEAVRAFDAGQIPFARDLDHACATYAAKHPALAPQPEPEDGPKPAGGDTAGGHDDDTFEVLSIADIKGLPDAQWLVDDVIPQCGLGFVYGAPGSFKSFVCYDMALALAYGHKRWLDKDVTPSGSVLYLASEGATGAKNRITAWQAKHGATADDGAFRLVRRHMSFMNGDDVSRLERTVEAIVEAHGPVGVIFVDTVSRVLPGADENLQKDMTIFVVACDRLRERFGATVIGVHHTNKQGDMRGSTVFLGQGDFVMRVEKNEDKKSGVLTCEKQKEAEDGWRVAFHVEPRAWVPDGRIKEVTSLTIAFGGEPREADGSRWPERETSKAVQRSLHEAWMKGRPWSPHRQAEREGRYAVRNIAKVHGLPAKVVDMMLGEWLSSEMISVEQVDSHNKMKGLKVLKWID